MSHCTLASIELSVSNTLNVQARHSRHHGPTATALRTENGSPVFFSFPQACHIRKWEALTIKPKRVWVSEAFLPEVSSGQLCIGMQSRNLDDAGVEKWCRLEIIQRGLGCLAMLAVLHAHGIEIILVMATRRGASPVESALVDRQGVCQSCGANEQVKKQTTTLTLPMWQYLNCKEHKRTLAFAN